MINVIFVCLISCCSWFMPLKDNLSCEKQDQIQEVEHKSRDNAFFSTHYAYYTFDEIARMIPNSLNSISDITHFGGYVTSGSVVINTEGTYEINSSFFTGVGFYYKNYNNTLVNQNYTLTNATFTNYESNYHYGWYFGFRNLPNTASYSINIHAYQCVDTFNGEQQYSWSFAFIPNGLTSEDIGRMYVLFDLNIWGDYFTYPTEELAYNQGYGAGYEYGYSVGKDKGYTEGLADSFDSGYQSGYTAGYNEGASQDATALTIMNGILEVGLLPVNVFLQMFNYEVFGINISGLISGLLTVAMTMILLRFLFGGKENDK